MLYKHCKLSHTFIELDIGLDHTGIFKGQSIIDVDVTRQLQFRVPYFHNRYLGRRDTNNTPHTICGRQTRVSSGVDNTLRYNGS